ncbi:MAG: hypothetical protein PHN42_04265 [Bacilli bacterium]|nr:hypothetical protein [Bacilli bacterium]
MKIKKYRVIRHNNDKKTIIDTKKINGYKVLPKNTFNYPGIAVDSMIIIKPVLIEKVLKKKIKRKLDLYLQYLITLIDDEGDNSSFMEALNEMSKYKEIVEYKYRLFLEDKYIDLLLKKISLLEHEIKSKQAFIMPKKEVKKREVVINDIQEEIVENSRKRR